jgi:hypothetical protein
MDRGLLRAHLVADHFSHEDFSESDVFRVSLASHERETSPVSLWARKVDQAERGMVLGGVTDPLPLSTWQRVLQTTGQVFSYSRVKVYRAFPFTCDFYSLGMLFARALLVGPNQSITQVEKELADIVSGLEPVVQGIDPHDMETLSRRIRARLKKDSAILSTSTILYHRNARGVCDTMLPDWIWDETVILMLRLLSRVPGFSFGVTERNSVTCGRHMPMESVTEDVERMAGLIRSELFGAHTRNSEIHQACELVKAEVLAVRN